MFRPRRPRLSQPALKTILPLIIVALLAGYGGAWLERRDEQNNVSLTNLSGQKKIVTGESRLISQIAKDVGPSVVSVNVTVTDTATDVFGFPQQQDTQGAGTGIILTKEGLVVTNRHVVPAGTTEVSLVLSDGTVLKDVTVIGRTSESDSLDVAFLKINDAKGRQLKPAVLGGSGTLAVGDNVVAIGNALGEFQNTVTSGIVSGFGRNVQAGGLSGGGSENLVDLIQTDAAINQGNSGGPLVNLNGQVIGINTAIAGDGAQNIGFAIPIDSVKGLISEVIKTNKVSRPYLGVRYVSLTPALAGEYGLKTTRGAFIVPAAGPAEPSILAGSPAAKAGLKERDVILSVNDTKIDQSHSLSSLLGSFRPGERVNLKVLRDGKTITLGAVLGTLPASE